MNNNLCKGSVSSLCVVNCLCKVSYVLTSFRNSISSIFKFSIATLCGTQEIQTYIPCKILYIYQVSNGAMYAMYRAMLEPPLRIRLDHCNRRTHQESHHIKKHQKQIHYMIQRRQNSTDRESN